MNLPHNPPQSTAVIPPMKKNKKGKWTPSRPMVSKPKSDKK